MTIPSPGTARPPAVGAGGLCRGEDCPRRRTATCRDATDLKPGRDFPEGKCWKPGSAPGGPTRNRARRAGGEKGRTPSIWVLRRPPWNRVAGPLRACGAGPSDGCALCGAGSWQRRGAGLAARLAVLVCTSAIALAGRRGDPPRGGQPRVGVWGRARRDGQRRGPLAALTRRAGSPVTLLHRGPLPQHRARGNDQMPQVGSFRLQEMRIFRSQLTRRQESERHRAVREPG